MRHLAVVIIVCEGLPLFWIDGRIIFIIVPGYAFKTVGIPHDFVIIFIAEVSPFFVVIVVNELASVTFIIFMAVASACVFNSAALVPVFEIPFKSMG